MNTKRAIALAGVGFLSLLLTSCVGQSRAARTPGPGQQWEYKVLKVDETAERDLTQFLNTESAGGWEYVGQLSGKEEHVVFKRPTGIGMTGATHIGGRWVQTAAKKAP